jgi:prepilin-type processing-associated H-X9-DG protein
LYRKQIFNLFLIVVVIFVMLESCCFAKPETFVLWQLPYSIGPRAKLFQDIIFSGKVFYDMNTTHENKPNCLYTDGSVNVSMLSNLSDQRRDAVQIVHKW